MPSENLKTTAITSLDATPPVRTTNYGQRTQIFYGSLTVTTGKTSGSVYQMIRLPSHAILHSLKIWLDGSVTTLDGDVTLYYSDTWADGTDAHASGGAVAAHVFQTALDLHAIVAATEYLLGGNIKGTNLGKMLWQMAGLTSDPGGFFDIVILTTSTNSGAAVINMQAVVGTN
jgi:hypothetical protein